MVMKNKTSFLYCKEHKGGKKGIIKGILNSYLTTNQRRTEQYSVKYLSFSPHKIKMENNNFIRQKFSLLL